MLGKVGLPESAHLGVQGWSQKSSKELWLLLLWALWTGSERQGEWQWAQRLGPPCAAEMTATSSLVLEATVPDGGEARALPP